ncbi:MAG: NAD-dependent epimerase/dehydratase family protein [Coriobacteriia bacterium]|nr:NAD-dependent epimerase/dehydratase family protein [Coriobacteriia bacterium]
MRVLVTGGAGFIGSSVVHALVARGDEVTVVDDLSTGSAGNLHPAADFHRMDVLDPELGDLARLTAPEAVVHLAAQVSVSESVRDPERDRLVNVEGTRALARAAAGAGARRMLSASSAAVYGEPSSLPVAEDAPKSPQNPYGRSKLEAESVLAEELRGTGVDFASLRFANVYGPRQDWRGEGGVVAVFAGRMAAGEPVVVNGDGTQTRDFVYVGDVAGAVTEALEARATLAGAGVDGPAYNISTGEETSVLELVGLMRPLIGYEGPVTYAPLPAGDVPRSSLAQDKAAGVLRWRARVSLDQGLRQTVRWFAAQR